MYCLPFLGDIQGPARPMESPYLTYTFQLLESSSLMMVLFYAHAVVYGVAPGEALSLSPGPSMH